MGPEFAPGPVGSRLAEETQKAEFEAGLDGFLRETLKDYNDRDVSTLNRRLDQIQTVIEENSDGYVELRFGGSVSKHTYVDGLSDADILCIMNESSLYDASPEEVLQYLEGVFAKKFQDAIVSAGDLAVTVTFPGEPPIQVLPSLATSAGMRIAGSGGEQWSNVIYPKEFARKLTGVNQACNGNVVPVIKLFKVLQEGLPEANRLNGYHIESLAIDSFERYSDRQSYHRMLLHFVREISTRVLSPLNDETGQSLHVDDYLGERNSAARSRISDSMRRLHEKLERASDDMEPGAWMSHFESE